MFKTQAEHIVITLSSDILAKYIKQPMEENQSSAEVAGRKGAVSNSSSRKEELH